MNQNQRKMGKKRKKANFHCRKCVLSHRNRRLKAVNAQKAGKIPGMSVILAKSVSHLEGGRTKKAAKSPPEAEIC